MADGATFQPQNNEQAYLAYAVGLITDADSLPAPRTIKELLLKAYCLNGGGGGGGGSSITGVPIEIAFDTEMVAALATAQPGTIYKYVGETTDEFEQGALYIVEEAD